jgi:hypothetical protein
MLDRRARSVAIEAIRRFRDRELSNRAFDDAFPSSPSDPALAAIASALWFFYDDLSEHKLEGPHALTQGNIRGFNRCIVYLASDEEYVAKPGLIRRLVAAITRQRLPTGTSRQSPVWPFASWAAYVKAIQSLGSAGAKQRGVSVEYNGALEEIAEWRVPA